MAWWIAIAGCRASHAPATDDAGTSTSSTTTTSTTGETSSSDGSEGSTSTAIVDGPPVVIDLGKSATFLEQDERLVITAFVQHPRGPEAVVEGVLVGPGEPADYGAFVRGVNGRWSIEVGWADIGTRMDLNFENEIVAEFEARFVDDAGLEGVGETGVRLRCSPLAPLACHGVCADVSVASNHCGQCDLSCEFQYPSIGVPIGGCDQGTCAPLWSECVDALEHANCDAVCAAFDTTCVESGCGSHTIMPIANDLACRTDQLPGLYAEPDDCAAAFVAPFNRCCCAID